MEPKKVLIAAGGEEFYQTLAALLKARGFQVINAPDAVSATATAVRAQPDLIMLDASLPGGGLEVAERMRLLPDLDMVRMILLGSDRRGTAPESLFKAGLNMFLSKPIDVDFLARSVGTILGGTKELKPGHEASSPEEGIVLAQEGARSVRGEDQLLDETTGLHNREAFVMLAEHQMRVSNRTRKGFALVLLKVSNLREIREVQGPLEAEHALAQTARTLKESFRSSDVIAHVGGGEFAVLALETKTAGKDRLTRRLYSNLKHLNSETARLRPVTLDADIVYYDPLHPMPLPELLKDHDTALARKV